MPALQHYLCLCLFLGLVMSSHHSVKARLTCELPCLHFDWKNWSTTGARKSSRCSRYIYNLREPSLLHASCNIHTQTLKWSDLKNYWRVRVSRVLEHIDGNWAKTQSFSVVLCISSPLGCVNIWMKWYFALSALQSFREDWVDHKVSDTLCDTSKPHQMCPLTASSAAVANREAS